MRKRQIDDVAHSFQSWIVSGQPASIMQGVSMKHMLQGMQCSTCVRRLELVGCFSQALAQVVNNAHLHEDAADLQGGRGWDRRGSALWEGAGCSHSRSWHSSSAGPEASFVPSIFVSMAT